MTGQVDGARVLQKSASGEGRTSSMLESAKLKIALLAGHGSYFSLLSAALKRRHDQNNLKGKVFVIVTGEIPSLRDAKAGTEGKSWLGAVHVRMCTRMEGSKRLISEVFLDLCPFYLKQSLTEPENDSTSPAH